MPSRYTLAMLTHENDVLFHLAQLAQRHALTRAKRRLARQSRKKRLAGNQLSQAPFASELPTLSVKQQIGNFYEDKALQLLLSNGYALLSRQLRCKFGEIDLVMRDDSSLVFVEVRRRESPAFGGSAASITHRKQSRLVKAARWHLQTLVNTYFEGKSPPCRFDVVTFEAERICWMRNTITM
jgi:putative endonuclease